MEAQMKATRIPLGMRDITIARERRILNVKSGKRQTMQIRALRDGPLTKHARHLLFVLSFGLLVVHAQTGFATLAPLAGITRLAAGEGTFALALRRDGVLLGWGANTTGTLGNGTTTPNLTPAPVAIPGGGVDVVALAPRTVFVLALAVRVDAPRPHRTVCFQRKRERASIRGWRGYRDHTFEESRSAWSFHLH